MIQLETLIELKLSFFAFLAYSLLLSLDKQFPVERFEATVIISVNSSTLPPPLKGPGCAAGAGRSAGPCGGAADARRRVAAVRECALRGGGAASIAGPGRRQDHRQGGLQAEGARGADRLPNQHQALTTASRDRGGACLSRGRDADAHADPDGAVLQRGLGHMQLR